jgi:hypothetical protein
MRRRLPFGERRLRPGTCGNCEGNQLLPPFPAPGACPYNSRSPSSGRSAARRRTPEKLMSLPRILFTVSCLAALVLAGCGKSGGGSGGNGQIRVFNAFPEAPALNITIAGTVLSSNLPFQGLTQYQSVSNGSQNFVVNVVGSAVPLVNTTTSIGGGTNYSYVIFGPSTAVGTILAVDGFADPGSGNYALRILNAAAGAGPIDVYVTAPGADLSNAAPTIGSVAYNTATAFQTVTSPGIFEIRITPSGTKTIIFDSTPKPFTERSGTTIVAYSKGGGTLVNVALLNSDGPGTGSIVDNLVAQYKVVNASLVASALNVFIDGSLQLSNIPYTGVSNYQQASSGTHTLTVQAQATPGANLLSITPNFSAATDTSIALVGTAGALAAAVLNDDNLPPATGSAGVRFVNTSASIASVDVFVNFSKQVSALATNTASSYVNLTATAVTGTTYEFDFNLSGTTTPVLKLPGVLLVAPHKYTVYLAGPSASLQAIVTQDD